MLNIELWQPGPKVSGALVAQLVKCWPANLDVPDLRPSGGNYLKVIVYHSLLIIYINNKYFTLL